MSESKNAKPLKGQASTPKKDGNSQPQKRPVDVASLITNRFIEQLEKGVVPWRQPWTLAGQPKNVVTKYPYRGINIWLLAMLGFARNCFITSKQLKELGAVGKEEEKGHPVIFWNWKEIIDEDSGEIKNVPFLRYYYVLNIDQCEGLPEESIPAPPETITNPIKRCEEIVSEFPQAPAIKFKEKKALYDPCLDVINIPKMDKFESSEAYYDTLFHQLVHATGHPTRLNRKELMQMAEIWGDQHSTEELIAEMAATHLKSICGFTEIYMKKTGMEAAMAWQEKLKADKNLIIYAGTKAQQAIDYILNVMPREKVTEQTTVATVPGSDKDEMPF